MAGTTWWRRLLALLGLATVAALAVRMERRGARRAAAPARPAPEPPPLPALADSWIGGPVGDLRVVEAGKGGERLPVLLIHGLAGTAEQWEPVQRLLARERRVVAVELRGHGGSDASVAGDYHVESYAQDVLAAADALDLRRFVLAGHSLGALVAIEVAGRNPERVRALALIDPNGDSTRLDAAEIESLAATLREDPRAELSFHWRQFLAGGGEATRRRVLDDLDAVSDQVLAESLVASFGYPPLPLLDAYERPVGLLTSDLNEAPQSLARLRPDLPELRLTGASHWLALDRPGEVAAFIAEMAAQGEAGRGI